MVSWIYDQPLPSCRSSSFLVWAEVGAGRSYLKATAEYRFPVLTWLGGRIFADYATDLGSGDTVTGEPGEVRDKPGSGFGYGVGLRVRSPFGPVQVDFGLNDQGDSQVHFGVGERFWSKIIGFNPSGDGENLEFRI